jgi:hypothetical protein
MNSGEDADSFETVLVRLSSARERCVMPLEMLFRETSNSKARYGNLHLGWDKIFRYRGIPSIYALHYVRAAPLFDMDLPALDSCRLLHIATWMHEGWAI